MLQARVCGLLLSRRMQAADRPPFQPVEAGIVLATAVGICAAAGALVGWAAGSFPYGLLAGVCIGIPVGIVTVYRRFRGYFS